MSTAATFTYLDVELDAEQATVTCRYRLEFDEFTEIAHLPGADLTRPGCSEAAELYFLLAGVSYFKTGAPARIDLGQLGTTATTREFLRSFYVHGLGEFALKNNLDLTDLEVVGPDASPSPSPSSFDVGRMLIPFGGGLDSIVTVAELAPRSDHAALFVAERPGARFEALEAAAAVTGLPILRAERSLDDKVFESARRGYLNGHVPVTGILSALGVLTALAHGYGALAMSNEQSASSATTTGPFGDVNHQWSKGLEFETGFRRLVAERIGAFEYFSWLRNRSELSIAQRFAELTEYHSVFRSCNRAFHQDPASRLDHWCGVCDKCLFIDLALSPHLSPAQLQDIFDQREPLENPALEAQLEILVGVNEGIRPFECVGDEEECREALHLAAHRPDRADNLMLQNLAQRTPESQGDSPSSLTFIPDRYATPTRLV